MLSGLRSAKVPLSPTLGISEGLMLSFHAYPAHGGHTSPQPGSSCPHLIPTPSGGHLWGWS